MGKVIQGVLFGGLLFLASFPILWWNEGRAVRTERALEEGQASVVSVPSGEVEPANDGKLVHLNGPARTDEKLRDPEFGIVVNALKLRRNVEMYQWDEERKDNKYSYRMRWSSRPINSDQFEDKTHRNPKQFLFKSADAAASKVTIGAFTLSAGMIDKMSGFEKLPPEGATLPANAKEVDGVIFIGANPASPQIGDHQIWFEIVRAGDYSVAGKQNGSALEPYPTKSGETVELCYAGLKSAKEIFQQAIAENTLLTWILRFAGLLVMTFGLLMILSPIQKVANVVPFLGDVVGFVLFLACGLISLALSLVTIGVAWLAYRPLLGGGLLAGALVALILVFMLRRKKGPTVQPT